MERGANPRRSREGPVSPYHNLKPLKDGLLATQVAQRLRRAIFSGQFRPGTQILESHVAKQLGVSQTTVREALGQLERLDLIRRVPNKGSFVSDLSTDEVKDRLEIRLLLEGLAWERAAERMGAEDFESLRERLEAVREAAEQQDMPRLADSELDFHRFIWHHSGSPTLALLLEQLTAPMFAFMTLERSEAGKEEPNPYERHADVVRALEQGPQEARRLLSEHLKPSYGDL